MTSIDSWDSAYTKGVSALTNSDYATAEKNFKEALDLGTDKGQIKTTLEKYSQCCREHSASLHSATRLSYIPYDYVMAATIIITGLLFAPVGWLLSREMVFDQDLVILLMLMFLVGTAIWTVLNGLTLCGDVRDVEQQAKVVQQRLRAL